MKYRPPQNETPTEAPVLLSPERMAAAVDRRAARERLEYIAKTEACAVDAAHMLVVAYVDGRDVLRCGGCGTVAPETLPRASASNLRKWRRGESLSAIEKMQLERQLHKMINTAETNGREPDPRHVAWLAELEAPGEKNMTNNSGHRDLTVAQPREVMTKTEATRFMDLAKLSAPPDQRELAMMLMQRTGLNPLHREIMVYENAILITADGWRKLINGSGQFDGMPFPPRYLTKDERLARGYDDPDDIVVEVALQRKGQRFPVYALGKANPKNPYRKNQVEAKFPAIMAETRAFKRAARTGFQDVLDGYQMPTLFGNDDDAVYIEGVAREVPADVDASTGEYITPASAPNVTAAQVAPAAHDTTLPITIPDFLPDFKRQRERLGWSREFLNGWVMSRTSGRGVMNLTAPEAASLLNDLGELPADADAAEEQTAF